MSGKRQFKIPCKYDFKQQDNADFRIYSIQKKLIHWKVCSASWRSGASTVATKMAQILVPGLETFYNIYNTIKPW